MTVVKCPHCGEEFSLSDSDAASLARQIRDSEFDKDVKERVTEIEQHLLEKHEAEVDAQKKEFQVTLLEETNKISVRYDSQIQELKEQLSASENEKQQMKAEIAGSEDKKQLAVIEAVTKAENESAEAKNRLSEEYDRKIKELEEKLAESESDRLQMKAELAGSEDKKQIAVLEAVNKVENEKRELEMKLVSEKEKADSIIKEKDIQIEYYKDLKARMSTKMIGETLEQHCQNEFNRYRATAFKNVYFEKDNDARSGSKGDYIYRENDGNGTEILSIMFEMKNEMDETATKHKNEDFLKELDKDRREKNCEYAVLVSMLEADNELYNSGIVDMSFRYEKMYVVRPQCFMPIITILRSAALNSLTYKQELVKAKNLNIDINNFEDQLNDFKSSFGRNCRIAHDHFERAIDEIDKTIEKLQKVKKELQGSDYQLNVANNKVDDISVKRLTRNNPTMTEAFEAVRREREKENENK